MNVVLSCVEISETVKLIQALCHAQDSECMIVLMTPEYTTGSVDGSDE